MGALALKDARMELKTTKEAKELLSKAAVLGGMDLSSFMLSTAMEKARAILLDHTSIQLSVQGQAQLATVLQKPVAPTEAMKELARPKRLTISATAKRGCLMVRVGDSGPGVPPAKRTKIFDPFFSTREKGSGLGLAIVHSIIDMHGGAIDVETRKGGGTLFSIMLPLTVPVRRADASGRARAGQRKQPAPMRG